MYVSYLAKKLLSKALFVIRENKSRLGGLFLMSIPFFNSARMNLVQQEKELTENILSVV